MVDLSGRVAIVTGAGGGLGREHALLLASRGARVVVNDLDPEPAAAVAAEIEAAGGEALAIAASVTDAGAVSEMVARTLGRWSRVDILVNNAGILRDKTFAKMELADFRLVVEVHLMGAVNCTKAVWNRMREQNYGRVILTTSSSGLYGNFGQSNYGAAKMALVGLMQTLALEGARNGIRVNCLAPTAATRMLEGLLPEQEFALLHPRHVSPAVVVLAGEDAPTRTILCAGAGSFAAAHVTLTPGIHLDEGADRAEQLAGRLDEVLDRRADIVPHSGEQQGRQELLNAGYDRAAHGRG